MYAPTIFNHGPISTNLLNITLSLEPRHEKTCLMPYANNKDADHSAHPRSLISAFVVRWLNSIIPILANPNFQDSS